MILLTERRSLVTHGTSRVAKSVHYNAFKMHFEIDLVLKVGTWQALEKGES